MAAGTLAAMSNVAREMVRCYFGIVGKNSDLRLEKIRELRARETEAQASGTAAIRVRREWLPVRGRPLG
jgi:hypothetical protein